MGSLRLPGLNQASCTSLHYTTSSFCVAGHNLGWEMRQRCDRDQVPPDAFVTTGLRTEGSHSALSAGSMLGSREAQLPEAAQPMDVLGNDTLHTFPIRLFRAAWYLIVLTLRPPHLSSPNTLLERGFPSKKQAHPSCPRHEPILWPGPYPVVQRPEPSGLHESLVSLSPSSLSVDSTGKREGQQVARAISSPASSSAPQAPPCVSRRRACTGTPCSRDFIRLFESTCIILSSM